MATQEQMVNAAKKPPTARTAADEKLIAKGSNIQAVRNADYEARRQARNP